MLVRKTFIAAASLMLLILALLPGISQGTTVINGAGATFPYPLYAKWFQEYAKVAPTVSFTYQPVGSGVGIERLLAGTVDFCGADVLPTAQQLKKAPGARIVGIPTAVGGIAVIYHVPGLTKGLKLTPDLVADIFRGKITSWHDDRISAINGKLWLPERRIKVVHRSDASGTTSIFTDYLSTVSKVWKQGVGRGMVVNWPVGTGRSGNVGVVDQVAATEYSIGYVELIYALEGNVPYASIKNSSGRFVEPNLRTIQEAASASAIDSMNTIPQSLVAQPGDESYPIVGLSWLLVDQHQNNAAKGKSLVAFLKWALTKGQAMAPFLYYAPLPANVAGRAMKAVESIQY